MNDVKIQINSTEALKRLLGDDPGIEAEVRKSVRFSLMKNMEISIDKIMEEEGQKLAENACYVKFSNNWDTHNVLKKEVQSKIKREVDKQVWTHMCEVVREHISGLDLDSRITALFEQELEIKIRNEVKKRLDKAITNMKESI